MTLLDELDDYEIEYTPSPYVQPTFIGMLRHAGLRAAVNYWAERRCIHVLSRYHHDASQKGFGLHNPGFKFPWWFSLISRLEFNTRPRR